MSALNNIIVIIDQNNNEYKTDIERQTSNVMSILTVLPIARKFISRNSSNVIIFNAQLTYI